MSDIVWIIILAWAYLGCFYYAYSRYSFNPIAKFEMIFLILIFSPIFILILSIGVLVNLLLSILFILTLPMLLFLKKNYILPLIKNFNLSLFTRFYFYFKEVDFINKLNQIDYEFNYFELKNSKDIASFFIALIYLKSDYNLEIDDINNLIEDLIKARKSNINLEIWLFDLKRELAEGDDI